MSKGVQCTTYGSVESDGGTNFGHVVSTEGLNPNLSKTPAISERPNPTDHAETSSCTQLSSLLFTQNLHTHRTATMFDEIGCCLGLGQENATEIIKDYYRVNK